MRGLRRSTQRARNKGKIDQGAAIQMNHFLLNVEMSEWRSKGMSAALALAVSKDSVIIVRRIT
jgi:hypothetical protein